MKNKKLFLTIFIPNTSFQDGELKPRLAHKFNFKLEESNCMTETLSHFVYSKNEEYIHSFYYFPDPENENERYLFIENNHLYDEFVSPFGVDRNSPRSYWKCSMDIYLDINNQEETIVNLNKIYHKCFIEEDETFLHNQTYKIS